MSPPAVRIWTEQLLFRGSLLPPLARRSAARQSNVTFRNYSSSTRSTASIRFSSRKCQQNALSLLRNERTPFSRRFRSLRFKSNKKPAQNPDPTPHLGSPEPAPSLSQRLKKLSREYGWLALGVYAGLTVLDFPFCFLGVRMLGTDRIGHYEHVVVESIKSVLRIPFPSLGKSSEATTTSAVEISEATAREGALGYSDEVSKALVGNGDAEACMRPVNRGIS